MCGIAGSLGSIAGGAGAPEEIVRRMTAAVAHRGPDDEGVWSDSDARICLGNRRLAVVDVTEAGHQPMHSSSGRYVITLNGEIYNHRDLRSLLESEGTPAWHSTSDTEVLIAGFEAWGIEATLKRCVGMFAVAVWDRQDRRLTLARDRIGEKSLYFGRFRGAWLFGSEVKAIAAHPHFQRRVDPQSLARYMALGYVPAPGSILSGLHKVMPGSLVTVDADSENAVQTTYWSAQRCARAPRLAFVRDVDAIDALEALLSQAVGQQMLADRPVGALLSGGIDSSTLVALMAARQSSGVKTFSIGFEESAFNEAGFAAGVARHCATDHTELYIDARNVRDLIPSLPTIHDEPFADISQIPAYFVSRLASRSVTVALTGDGGDELFGGYPRYAMGARLWQALLHLPPGLRPAFGALLERAPGFIDLAFARAFPHDEASGLRGLRPAQKLAKLGHAVRSRDLATLYWRLLAPWAERRLLRDVPAESSFPPDLGAFDATTVEEEFMLRDLVGYLPDDILTKMDRASMAVSIESRAPLLDHRVVEFALQLPFDLKFRAGVGKWLLREVLYRHVPKKLVDRPKMGFGIPIASWLRGPLKPWAYDLIASSRGDLSDMLDLRAVRRMLDRHSSGLGDWHQPLWTALMFLNWTLASEVRAEPIRGARPGAAASDGTWAPTPQGA